MYVKSEIRFMKYYNLKFYYWIITLIYTHIHVSEFIKLYKQLDKDI